MTGVQRHATGNDGPTAETAPAPLLSPVFHRSVHTKQSPHAGPTSPHVMRRDRRGVWPQCEIPVQCSNTATRPPTHTSARGTTSTLHDQGITEHRHRQETLTNRETHAHTATPTSPRHPPLITEHRHRAETLTNRETHTTRQHQPTQSMLAGLRCMVGSRLLHRNMQ